MDEQFYLYNEKSQKTKKVTAEEYRQHHPVKPVFAIEAEQKKANFAYFTGIRAKTKAILPQYLEMDTAAGEAYKDQLTEDERAEQKKTSGTEIYVKHENAARVGKAQKKLENDIEKRCTATAEALRVSKEDLRDIGAFFGSNKTENVQLARSWMNRENFPAQVFEILLNVVLHTSFDGLDLSTESKLAQNAEKMEKISAQYELFLRVLSDHRELYDNLKKEDRDLLVKKMGEANGILNYYRLMRTVITDPYYMNHENRELALKNGEQDTPQQKRLSMQLWMARGGLKVLTDYGVKTLDDKLDDLCGRLSTQVVTEKQLKTRKELNDRYDEIEKYGLSGRLNHMRKEGKLKGIEDKGSNQSILFRARHSVKKLPLPESVEKAVESISMILDQLDFLEAFSKEKVTSRNSWLMEHNYRDFAVMEKVESLSGPLKEMKEAILAIISVDDRGGLTSGKVSGETFTKARKKYKAALKAYRNGMREADTQKDCYLLPPSAEGMTELLASADKARRAFGNPKVNATEKQKENTREKIRSMMLRLAENQYSDAFIYENAKEIMELMKEKYAAFGSNAAEFDNFNHICFLAQYLYAGKRRMDIAEAKKQNLSRELRNALDAEDEKLKEYVENKAGEPLPALGTARNIQYKARIQTEKDSHDLADLKATAAHYLFQEEWAKNSRRTQTTFTQKVSKAVFSGLTRFLGWIFGKPKTMDHGQSRYEESKRKLDQLPQGIDTFGNEGANHTIHHGDGSYAPPVELHKYFKDPMKITLATSCNDILASMEQAGNYPQYVRDAVEALSSYCRVRGIVNRDTFEMEQAFLDKFRVSVNEILGGNGEFVNKNPVLAGKLLKTYKDMLSLSNGNLRSKMTEAELEAAKEQKAIYVTDTYSKDMKESNMRELPLFPHSPNLNDVKQGTVGDCYLVAATQTILAESPDIIRDMFTDLGNGEVLVRLYATYGEVSNPDGSKEFRRVDDPEKMEKLELRPVYVKVKKQYTTGEAHSSDCMWMQLLEVAYAAAGFNHGESEVKEDGELINLNSELTDGDPQAALMHLAGKQYTNLKISSMMVHTMEQTDVEKSSPDMYMQMHILLHGVDPYLREPIYTRLKAVRNDDINNGIADAAVAKWERSTIETAVRQELDLASKTNVEWKAALDTLFTQGKLTKTEKDDLVKKIKDRYCSKGEKRQKLVKNITDKILQNIKKPENASLEPPQGFRSLSLLASEIKTLSQEAGEQKPAEEEQKPAEVKEPTTYKRILELFDQKISFSAGRPLQAPRDAEKKAIRLSVSNYLTFNPGNRYTQRELGVLRLVRQHTMKGGAVCFADRGHVRTALDTRFHNGKWFILVRDPFNVYRNEYTIEGDEVKTKSYGLGSTLLEHFAIRGLTPDLRNGFLGTCWYELKDIAKEVRSLQFRTNADANVNVNADVNADANVNADEEDDFMDAFEDQD